MKKSVTITPDENSVGIRIDIFLSKELSETRSRIKSLIEEGKVFHMSVPVKKAGEKVSGEITVEIDDPVQLSAKPQDIPLDIVYQDSELAVINKPQGMVTHPAMGSPDGTMVNAVLHHISDLSSINGVYRPGIVHRLDKDTSGLIVIAKTNAAHLSLSKQIAEKTAGRYYLGLVVGNIKEDEGTIDQPIGRNPSDRKKFAVVKSGGRRAVTHFKVVERFIKYTLVEFKLETGRTHQIRVHSRYMNNPIAGDPAYGVKDAIPLNGQFLHAYKLELNHPTTNERMTFTAPLPEKFLSVLERLRKTLDG